MSRATHKKNKTRNSFTPSCVMVTWEDKCPDSEYPPHCSLLSPAWYAKCDTIWPGISLAVTCPDCPLPLLPLCTPPVYFLVLWGAKQALTVYKCYSAVTKASLCFRQHCCQHKSKTQPLTSCWRKQTLSQQKTGNVLKSISVINKNHYVNSVLLYAFYGKFFFYLLLTF